MLLLVPKSHRLSRNYHFEEFQQGTIMFVCDPTIPGTSRFMVTGLVVYRLRFLSERLLSCVGFSTPHVYQFASKYCIFLYSR